MRFKTLLLALVFLSAATGLCAQDAGLTDPCHVMPKAGTLDAKHFLTFDRFDKELRAALTNQDALALAFLVKFPLRVNDSGSTISIDNAEALKMHFQEVFTPAVRKEILAEKLGEDGCMTAGIGYGLGVIWVNANDLGYAIWSVNVDAVLPSPKASPNSQVIKYVCQTLTHRIVVDSTANGIPRYRSWNKPKPLTDLPDLEIVKGEATFEGTNVCAVQIYTFKSGTATYRVEGGLGCWGDNEPGPPKDSTGRLEITVAGKPATDTFCY